MNQYSSEQLDFYENKKILNPSLISLNRLNRVNSVHIYREKKWDNRFIYNKIPEYDAYKDKNVRINLSVKSNSSRRNANNAQNLKNIIPYKLINGDNSLNNSTPIAFRTSFNPKNDRDYKISSAKVRDISCCENNNLKYINIINLNNINKLWDDLCVGKSYRDLFCVIYKELNDENKQEMYQKEINELISLKTDINFMKSNIEMRQNTIKEISELNDKLGKEIEKSKNIFNNKHEHIINEISKKIELLRQNTVDVCVAMKKLKYEINGIKNLNKYDIDLISEKYDFDKNYLIKMKKELNFLKSGYTKQFFNIEKDQTPFLLSSSENCLAKKSENNNLIHIVPINKEIKNDIIDCIYYIYQELIAYQSEKVSKNILKRISPLKRVTETPFKGDKNNFQIINGIEDNKKINKSNFILKKCSSLTNTLKMKEQYFTNLNIKEYIYNKKKFFNFNKNGKSFKFTNPLIIPNTLSKKSEINRKKNNIMNNLMNSNNNKLNVCSRDNDDINQCFNKNQREKSKNKSEVKEGYK